MRKEQGFTLTEVLIAASIVLALALALSSFARESLRLNRDATQRLSSEFSNLKSFRLMLEELRGASAISSVSSTSLSFELRGEEVSYLFDNASSSLLRISGTSTRALIQDAESATSSPVFLYDGGLVEVRLNTHGKEHFLRILPRNLNQNL